MIVYKLAVLIASRPHITNNYDYTFYPGKGRGGGGGGGVGGGGSFPQKFQLLGQWLIEPASFSRGGTYYSFLNNNSHDCTYMILYIAAKLIRSASGSIKPILALKILDFYANPI